jgi:hypothetical protein
MRWRLPWTERKRQKALEQVFETTKYFAHKNENGKMKGVATLFNIGFYLLIAHRDIQAVKIDALTHPNEWTRKLHARVILLTIYEWDADEVSGQALREAMELMLIPDELRSDAFASLKNLRKIREKVNKKFHDVRNAATAHRDPNALVQYRAIRDLNVQDVWNIAAEFFVGVETFMSVLTRLMAAGNTIESYLRQWLMSAKTEEGAKAGQLP